MTTSHASVTLGRSAPPLLRLQDVSLRIGDDRILASVSLDIRRGERLALLGSKMSGALALLRCLARCDGDLLTARRTGCVTAARGCSYPGIVLAPSMPTVDQHEHLSELCGEPYQIILVAEG